MYFENLRKCFKNGPENLKNRGLEGVWELLGEILKRKTSQKLSWLILVNFGRARIDQNLAKRTKMAPSWSQAGAKILQVGAKMAILTPFGTLS